MKIQYAIAASVLLSVSAFAQKDELKALKKLTEKQQPAPADIQEMGTLLSQVESKMGAATPEQQIDYNYFKGMYNLNQLKANPNKSQAVFEETLASFNKVVELEKAGKKKYTPQIEQQIYPALKSSAVSGAESLGKAQMFNESALFYAAAYKIDPKDAFNLYNAAASSVNAKNYDRALDYYLELDRIGFTGESVVYTAKNKATGVVEAFPNKSTRDIAVQSAQYILPQEEKTPSVKGEIVKNIALIYNTKGETEKAKAAFANARKANPDDTNLIIAEADLHFKAKDMAKYKELISEAIQKSPNDADLYYNLGVVTGESDANEAITYYNKALQIKPNYVNANINLGLLMLKDEKKIVEQMNAITGNTAKDNQRYDALKKQREAIYNKALPYFEKAHKDEPDNQYVISTLASIYQAIDRMDDYKAMKAKIKS
ncbi:tetratricopeptide repeat protein [Flavobacterium hauense]